jgi:hypothetical protein
VITLPTPVERGQAVLLNYTGPGTGDIVTNPAANLTGLIVDNITRRNSGGGSSGGCMPGYPCSQIGNFSNTTLPTTNISSKPDQESTCPMFTQYLKKGMRDGNNGISEVSKVQSFLAKKLGKVISIDGTFGKQTYNAVKAYQTLYREQVLTPWGLSGPTGWWYQSSRSYANFLENCSEGLIQLDNTVKVQDGVIKN